MNIGLEPATIAWHRAASNQPAMLVARRVFCSARWKSGQVIVSSRRIAVPSLCQTGSLTLRERLRHTGNQQMGDEGARFEVGIAFGSVLEAISKQIYDTPYAFLRENLQNAIDASRIQAVLARVSRRVMTLCALILQSMELLFGFEIEVLVCRPTTCATCTGR